MTRRFLTLLAALAVLAPASALAESGAAERSIPFKACGKLDIGYTDARIQAKRVRCGDAKTVIAVWLEKADSACNLGVCPIIQARGFRCKKLDSRASVTVRCARKGGKIVRARWGD